MALQLPKWKKDKDKAGNERKAAEPRITGPQPGSVTPVAAGTPPSQKASAKHDTKT